MKTNRVLNMTKGNPLSLLARFAAPLFLGNVLQQLYNIADTALAGNILGDDALAQIGATAALYSLITNTAFGLNNGLSLSVSRYFGAEDDSKMKKAVCWMVLLSVASALVMTFGFMIFRHPLLKAMRVSADISDGAESYLAIILAGIPLTMVYNLEASLLRALGNSRTPLAFLLFSSILNVILDIVFMKYLPFGVQGAAAATILSQGISAALGLVYIMRNYPELRFGKKELRAEPGFIAEMYISGLSMALMSSIYNIGSVMLQSSINALGKLYISAQVGGRRLAELIFTLGTALGTSTATYSSQNYGAGRGDRIKKGIRTAILIYWAWWLIALAFVFTLAEPAVRLVTGSDNREIISNGVQYLRISIPMIPPMAVLVIIRNAMQGTQHTVSPLICSTLELAGKLIFAFFIVPVRGYLAVCICEPVTWVICFVFIMIAYLMCRDDIVKNTAQAG